MKSTKRKAAYATFLVGAGGGTRTHTMSPSTDFESVTSANSITPAYEVVFCDPHAVNEAIVPQIKIKVKGFATNFYKNFEISRKPPHLAPWDLTNPLINAMI